MRFMKSDLRAVRDNVFYISCDASVPTNVRLALREQVAALDQMLLPAVYAKK